MSLVDWLESDPDELRRRYDRLFVPRNDGRLLQRNAAIARENGRAAVEEAAARVTAILRERLPEAEISLTGSASCPEFDARDVDLVALVEDVRSAAARLALPPLYREQWRDDWAAFRLEGTPTVDIVVTRRGTRGDAHHRRAWELLRADPALREEYRAVKGSSVEKAAFFERLVARLGDDETWA